MADYYLIKIQLVDGGSPPKIVSDIDNGNLQLTETPTTAIVKKWDTTTLDEVIMTEIAEAFAESKAIAEATIVGEFSSIYIDVDTIV